MDQSNKTRRKILFGLFLLGIFILAIVVWYSPVLFKGYAAYGVSPNALLARNLFQTGSYSMENNLNVLLSSDLIESQGNPSTYGNRLTSLAYARVFEIIGLPEIDNFILLSIFIHALTLLIFTGLVFYLFDFKTSLFFSLIYIFLPINWSLPYHLGGYEFALFFVALFFLFYFYGLRQRHDYVFLVMAGLFLALAGLAKETFLLIVPFLIIYLWLTKQKKSLAYILIPWAVIFFVFWLPSAGSNINTKLVLNSAPEETKSADFASYGHLFPDPYTYHFAQEEFLSNLQDKIDNNQLDFADEIYIKKTMNNLSIGKGIGLFDRAKVGLMIFSKHLFKFISLEDTGGPFVFFLMFLGAYSLRQKRKKLFQFLIYWVFSTVFLFAFAVLVTRSHLMDFSWALVLLAALGLSVLVRAIADYLKINDKKIPIVYLIVLLLVLYNLVLVNHVVWSNSYNQSNSLMLEAYSQEIKKLNISSEDIIGVDLSPDQIDNLNYLTNKSLVYFTSDTVNDLLNKNELKEAFDKFGVKYVLAYSDEMIKKITQQAEVINIASDSLDISEYKISANKSWLMNLIK